MRNLIIAVTMIIPMLATGAVAATTAKQAAEKATCSFEPSTGTYGDCGRNGENRGSRGDHGDHGGRNGGRR